MILCYQTGHKGHQVKKAASSVELHNVECPLNARNLSGRWRRAQLDGDRSETGKMHEPSDSDIYRATCFWLQPFLSSFLTFHKWLHTVECIVEWGQWVLQNLAVTNARAIHTDTPSMLLCEGRIKPCSVRHDRETQSCGKQGNESWRVLNFSPRILLDPIRSPPFHTPAMQW